MNESMAHITEDGRVHPLDTHLWATAELAGEFAAAFGFREWGRLAGVWHDLGKYTRAFQKNSKPASRLLACIAAGRHAFLP
ncbi:MAG: CRISPR-associated endonuclease Cas3'', partial [Syntrophobacteraceae bacterium]|nr:CRISPR-associated endonuclease Cas3'' [Syntrophobacteraceae bacterium]